MRFIACCNVSPGKVNAMKHQRVMYFAGGPANLIAAHRHWRSSEHTPTEVSVTFSSQIQDACQVMGCPTYMVSVHREASRLEDGLFTIEHRPKRDCSGAAFHAEELRYALNLLVTALRFKATVAFVDSGTAHFFLISLFRICGIRVVPILHNTLWPTGFFPTRATQRLLLQLDRFLFWKWAPSALIAVSPECERQVRRLVPKLPYRAIQVRAQFQPEYFANIPRPTFPSTGHFNILFIGRVERMKGVFDILEMAKIVNAEIPGRVKWRICGAGSDLAALTARHLEMQLTDSVELMGWVSLEALQKLYADTHACIVPTRSSFNEALAMTAAEAVLAGRPLISNPVVPATELLAPACLIAQTNDVGSHAAAVIELAQNPALFNRLSDACIGLAQDFLDRERGLGVAVQTLLAEIEVG